MFLRHVYPDDAIALEDFILQVTKPFCGVDFTSAGWEWSKSLNTQQELLKKILDRDYFSLCFENEGNIVGLIRMFEFKKIDQLFVSETHRNKGIAIQLWKEAKKICDKAGFGEHFWVKSSSVAVPVYQKFGFVITDEPQQSNGCAYIPMEMDC